MYWNSFNVHFFRVDLLNTIIFAVSKLERSKLFEGMSSKASFRLLTKIVHAFDLQIMLNSVHFFLYWCKIGFSKLKRLKYAVRIYTHTYTQFFDPTRERWRKKMTESIDIRMNGDVWDASCVLVSTVCRTQYDPITYINAKNWKREKPMLFWYLLYMFYFHFRFISFICYFSHVGKHYFFVRSFVYGKKCDGFVTSWIAISSSFLLSICVANKLK